MYDCFEHDNKNRKLKFFSLFIVNIRVIENEKFIYIRITYYAGRVRTEKLPFIYYNFVLRYFYTR